VHTRYRLASAVVSSACAQLRTCGAARGKPSCDEEKACYGVRAAHAPDTAEAPSRRPAPCSRPCRCSAPRNKARRRDAKRTAQCDRQTPAARPAAKPPAARACSAALVSARAHRTKREAWRGKIGEKGCGLPYSLDMNRFKSRTPIKKVWDLNGTHISTAASTWGYGGKGAHQVPQALVYDRFLLHLH
jgi:hypothetical protein